MKRFFLIGLILFSANTVYAKVFDFGKVIVSSYFRATGGTSIVNNEAFLNSGGEPSGNPPVFETGTQYNFSGEFGFSFEMGSVATRLGLELIRPKSIVEHEAKNPAGTVLYSVDSEILGINPILTFEWSFIKSKESKVYAFAGGGLSVTRMQNTFTMTADGISELGVSSDFIEKGVANDVAGHIGFGFEILMVDNVTFMSEVGYRSLIARTFKSSTTTNSFVGAIAEGDVLKNHDGKDRSVDLSGPFVGIGFRFYL